MVSESVQRLLLAELNRQVWCTGCKSCIEHIFKFIYSTVTDRQKRVSPLIFFKLCLLLEKIEGNIPHKGCGVQPKNFKRKIPPLWYLIAIVLGKTKQPGINIFTTSLSKLTEKNALKVCNVQQIKCGILLILIFEDLISSCFLNLAKL